MAELTSRHSDRLRFHSIGESPGFYNAFEGVDDPKDIFVAEVTNNIADEPSFSEKDKVVFVLSIHGDERSGVESGTRFIERLLEGQEPAVESLLDDLVLLFVYANPDGWVAQNQQYEFSTDYWDADTENSFKRQTATDVDPNRLYPTVGWINPSHYPAEPNGLNLVDDEPGVDSDVVSRYTEVAPDALDIVEHLRGYDNLAYGSDLHGMFTSPDFIEGLLVNDQYDHQELHDIYEMNRRLDERLESLLGDRLDASRSKFEDLNETLTGDRGPVPEEAYAYGTILDTIGYTTSGTLISWMSHPPEQGGLGVTMMAHEMGWDNRAEPRIEYRPWLVDLQVDGYKEVIRAVSEHAVRSVDATIETGSESTAYVETDAVQRTSAALDFDHVTDRVTSRQTVTVDRGRNSTTLSVPDGASSISVSVRLNHGFAKATLRNPSGERVRHFNPFAGPGRSTSENGVEWVLEDPPAGEWNLTLTPLKETTSATATVSSTALLSDADGSVSAPNPVEALGYQQRSYSVSPLAYFEDYEAFVTDGVHSGQGGNGNGGGRPPVGAPGTLEGVGIDAVRDGALLRGQQPAVDNLVLTHAHGADQSYLEKLAAYVDAGGTLVVTDRAVELLGDLDAEATADISPQDIHTFQLFSGFLGEKDLDHPLMDGVRPIQAELWKPAPMGYPISFRGATPFTGIDPEAFAAAGGTAAGIAYENPFNFFGERTPWVGAGTLSADNGGTVQLVGALLPPGKQTSLHPFGLREYTVSFLGHTVLTNALGFVQKRYVNGDLVKTFGD
ncbi:M14 family zinc carboxypeptidase [Haloarchaeobius amylolyticus]|uniref:M14 family zinc carboxypeptidase n=1 Tax=Haloarchaeobius amylolyticus TaxID=1198296 RepID=UPI0026E54A90|nr:M14 family zinc carboxypeptidase [Haloarchaeobius amylolyticus]